MKKMGLSQWEAFLYFDADNNARLTPAELYGALRWLQVPDLTAEDVVDFFELVDHNRDGMIDYAEYVCLALLLIVTELGIRSRLVTMAEPPAPLSALLFHSKVAFGNGILSIGSAQHATGTWL